MPKIPLTSEFAIGKFTKIREVKLKDAEFILELRCDEKKSQFLHKTEFDIPKQEAYLKSYQSKNDEYYFIITDLENTPLGTIRIYDMKSDTFTSGSWLMIDKATTQQVLEGNFLMLNFAHKALKYAKFNFDVRKLNKKVLAYHKAMGAKIISQNELDFFFEADLKLYLSKIRALM